MKLYKDSQSKWKYWKRRDNMRAIIVPTLSIDLYWPQLNTIVYCVPLLSLILILRWTSVQQKIFDKVNHRLDNGTNRISFTKMEGSTFWSENYWNTILSTLEKIFNHTKKKIIWKYEGKENWCDTPWEQFHIHFYLLVCNCLNFVDRNLAYKSSKPMPRYFKQSNKKKKNIPFGVFFSVVFLHKLLKVKSNCR